MISFSCAPEKTVEPPAPRALFSPAADTDGQITILLYYDMEGISGQKILRSIDFGSEAYPDAQEWLTNDVNAVVDGLFAGGADAVEVVDAHGSFNPEPDILLDRMDPRATMLYRDKQFGPYVDLLEEGRYDAIVALCMHSKTGGGGFGSHTVILGTDWILNDMSINETELLAYSWGRAGVPLILVSGDDKLGEELSWMNWLEYVTVKTALGQDDAELRPFDDVHQDMRSAAERAVHNIPGSRAVKLTEPIKAQLRVVHPADLSALENVPGIDYQDQTVTFQAADFQEAYDGIRAFMEISHDGYWEILQNIALSQEDGGETFMRWKDEMFKAWIAQESGVGETPAPAEEPADAPAQKYFGSR
jgi:D-amino peptidase